MFVTIYFGYGVHGMGSGINGFEKSVSCKGK